MIAKTTVDKIVSDFKQGAKIVELAKKYGMKRNVVRYLVTRELGYIKAAKIKKVKLDNRVICFYNSVFMTVAEAVADGKMGVNDLRDALNISNLKIIALMRDLLSDEAYGTLAKRCRRRGRFATLKREIKDACMNGERLVDIAKRFRISCASIHQILDSK